MKGAIKKRKNHPTPPQTLFCYVWLRHRIAVGRGPAFNLFSVVAYPLRSHAGTWNS
jgi:hypothetical protein